MNMWERSLVKANRLPSGYLEHRLDSLIGTQVCKVCSRLFL